MRERIKKTKNVCMVIFILEIVLGLCLLIWPETSLLTLCYLFGVLMLVNGLVKMVGYFQRNVLFLPFYSGLAVGLLEFVFGLFLVVNPSLLGEVLPLLIGFWVLLDSLYKIQTAFDLKRAGIKNWWVLFCLSLLCCVGGICIILQPFKGALVIMLLIGAMLVADGIDNLVTLHYISKHIKDNIEWQNDYFDLF